MERIHWERAASVAVCIAAGAILIRIAGKTVFSILLPFLIAWLLSLFLTPLSDRVSEKLHISSGICAAVLLTLVLSLTVFLIGAALNRLLLELQKLLARLPESGLFTEDVASGSFDYFEKLTSGIPLFDRFRSGDRYPILRERFNRAINELLGDLLHSLSEWLPGAAGKMVSYLPSVLLFAVVTVVAGFYFCTDRRGIENAVIARLPAFLRLRIPHWRDRARHVSFRYVRAYLFLLLLTFAELFLGFCLLKIEYAFLLALFVALVDLLPILGVGTVLVPWAIIELFRRNFYVGIGLLILWLLVTVLRQIAEPKLVGRSLGLHPLLTLAAGYAGWKCFGVIGMALAPVLVLLAKGLFRRERADDLH